MRDQDLKNQTRSVREEFSKITDSEVDGDERIQKLKSDLETARSHLRSTNQKNDRTRSILANLESDIVEAQEGIAQVDAMRAEAIATALIDEADFSADDALLVRRLELERMVERLTIAKPALERQQRANAREVELTAQPCVRLEERIGEVRDSLKLQLARRRHGF